MCTDDGLAVAWGSIPADAEPVTTIPLEPVDSLVITTLVDNVTDVFMPDQGPARRVPLGQGPTRPATIMEDGNVLEALTAEHGFSVLVTITKGGRERRLIFDAGISPDGMVENMRRLQIDPTSAEAVVCSHGHFDHTTGIDGLIRAVGRANMPLLIHPHFWRRRRIVLPGIDPIVMPTTSKRALLGAGFEIIEDRQPSFLFDNSVLITGEVPRVTSYERGFPPQQAWISGKWEPDPLILDDQALIVRVADKGLVVVTGCGHAGIVNTARHAQALTGGVRIHAIMGGFHLSGPLFEPLIPRVVADLAALSPDWLSGAHCTGWRAQQALTTRFGDAYIPSAVGTSLNFAMP